jgi:Fe-S-cluster containining protein
MLTTDIVKIEKLSKQKADENWNFRSFLKSTDIPFEKIDSIVQRLNREVSAQIDCTTCANCCKTVSPVLDKEDIVTFAKGLGISPEQLKSQYLVKDEEGFTFNAKPCPFLVDNKCSNYDHRPKACASYPHLHKDDFVFRTIGIINNCSVCPIVFNVVERLKDEMCYDDEFDEFEEFS